MKRNIFLNNSGLSFIEVTLALVILSVGLLGIFRTFILSLDRIGHLNIRLHMTHNLDNELISLKKTLRQYQALPFDSGPPIDTDDDGALAANVEGPLFERQMELKAIEGFANLFECHLALVWKERLGERKLSRSLYLLDFSSENKSTEP